MCDHCRNITETCPVCGQTDRSEPVEILTKVTHCSDCPMGEYWTTNAREGYNCHFDPNNIRTVLYVMNDSDLLADEQPLPDDCDLRTKTITIKLNQ